MELDKMTLKLLTLLVFVLANLWQLSSQQECDMNEARKIDSVMAKLLTIGNSGRQFPEAKGKPLKDYCDESKNLISQIETYKNKCLKDLPKQVTGVIVYSVNKAITQLCKKDSKRLTELIGVAPCMNKGSDEINKCYSKYIDGVLGAKHASDKKKIPMNCCEYYKIFACMDERLKTVKGCDEKQSEIGQDFIKSLFGQVIDMICQEYTEGSDKCAKLEATPKKKKNQRRSKSFMIPLVDLLSSFKEL